MSYDAEAEARRHAQHVDPAWLAPILRAAYAAGERAGAERMRGRAARWHDERERAADVLAVSALHFSAARAIRALPLDGGDHG